MATKDYASPAQARLMRARAHGWTPKNPRGDLPSRAVAQEFVDVKDRGKPKKKARGGISMRGDRGGLGVLYQEGGDVWTPWGPRSGLSDKERAFLNWTANLKPKGTWSSALVQIRDRMLERAALSPEERGIAGAERLGTQPLTLRQAGRRLGTSGGLAMAGTLGYLTRHGWTQGEGGRWYPPESTYEPPPEQPDRDTPVLPGGEGMPPPPGAAPPPFMPPPSPVRPSPYSEQLRAHKQRVAQSLAVPPGGYAGGGAVRGYQKGGEAGPRPGHPEDLTRGRNPYPPDSARYRLWERKYHTEEAAPPPEASVPRESLPDRVRRLRDKSQEELERLGEGAARGGAVGYQAGGLVASMEKLRNRLSPPMGGVPPRIEMQFGGRVPGGAVMPPVRPRMSTPLRMPPGMVKGPRIAPPPGKDLRTPPIDSFGGRRVPPNLRGYLQTMRMMNRPPAMTGRGVNRVGQGDQQGGLSRALQRGTGRPPMSRRQGFYR